MKGVKTTCLVLAALLLLVAAVASAGCGDQASASENQVLSGLEPFVGQAALRASQSPTETVMGDVTQYRDGKLTQQVEASDPRLSGTAEVTFNLDERADGSANLWGSSLISNDKGTWVCDKWTGAVSTGYTEQYVFNQAQGTGDYEGYTLYLLQHFYDTYETMSAPSASSAWTGWIEKTE
jgi:hypothetical protein